MTGHFHHIVPAFILRRFVGDDGKIFTLDIRTKSVLKKPVKYTGGKTDFYSFPVPLLGGAIAEDLLQAVESDAARVIKNIYDNKNSNKPNKLQREKIARFIAIQSFRTEAFFEGLRLTNQISREKLFAELWRSIPVTETEMLSRDWFLMEALAERQFYIGDHPVALQDLENPSSGMQLGIDVPGVEVFFPISPSLVLWIPPQSITDEIVNTYMDALRLHQEVRIAALSGLEHYMANPDGLRALQRVLFSAKHIHDAQVSGKPITANDENIDNFNALQIMFSTNEIFSQDGNFEFALRVLTETPKYAETVKTSLDIILPDDEGLFQSE